MTLGSRNWRKSGQIWLFWLKFLIFSKNWPHYLLFLQHFFFFVTIAFFSLYLWLHWCTRVFVTVLNEKKEINLDNAMKILCFTKKITKIAKFGQIFGDFSYVRPRISAMMIEFVILIMWRLPAIIICCQKSEN